MTAIFQQPIIRAPVFAEDDCCPIIKSTTSWLLGTIHWWDGRVHTLLSGFGHYPTTYRVIPLFVSFWWNTDGEFIDYLGYLSWGHEDRGTKWLDCCAYLVVEGCVPKPVLWWSTLGKYDLRSGMALTCRSELCQWSGPCESPANGDPWLDRV